MLKSTMIMFGGIALSLVGIAILVVRVSTDTPAPSEP